MTMRHIADTGKPIPGLSHRQLDSIIEAIDTWFKTRKTSFTRRQLLRQLDKGFPEQLLAAVLYRMEDSEILRRHNAKHYWPGDKLTVPEKVQAMRALVL